MMRKKNHIQNNDLSKMKGAAIENPSAKVAVQYIQEQLAQKSVHTNDQDDIEIENVEYLDENPNVEEYIEEPSEKDEFEDNFYPNAIHCLLDLYKTKYESLDAEESISSMKVFQIWRDIAKHMQESFFEFNERQAQQKYRLLRDQYFDIQTKEDIENFDYFEKLHDIYKDLDKENIAEGLNRTKISSVYYKDEILLQPEHLESNEEHLHDFKSEEIVHKEHEFIDMVEKELQAMEDGLHADSNKETKVVEVDKKDSKQADLDEESILEHPAQNLKRVRSDVDYCIEQPQRKQKLNKCFEIKEFIAQSPPSAAKTDSEFSFYHYNQEQERRHREKMILLEKNLQIQERALEQQQQLLQELIKRLPS